MGFECNYSNPLESRRIQNISTTEFSLVVSSLPFSISSLISSSVRPSPRGNKLIRLDKVSVNMEHITKKTVREDKQGILFSCQTRKRVMCGTHRKGWSLKTKRGTEETRVVLPLSQFLILRILPDKTMAHFITF